MEIFLTYLVDLIITVFAYLLVPTIFCISTKRLTLPKIKKIVIINGAIVWLIFMIIRIEAGIDGTNLSVLLWSYIAYFMMKKCCLGVSDNVSNEKVEKNEKQCINISDVGGIPEKQVGPTHGDDIHLIKENENLQVEKFNGDFIVEIDAGTEPKPTNHKAQSNGKYVIIILVMLLLSSLIINLTQHIAIKRIETYIDESIYAYDEEYGELRKYYYDYKTHKYLDSHGNEHRE